MTHRNFLFGWRTLAGVGLLALCGLASAADCPAYLNRDFQVLRSKKSFNICKSHPGKPLLIVNTASHCGFTPQFKALQAIHEKYKDRGLLVVGFPSNDFNQEASDESKTAEVCFINYGVKFTMLAPSSVRGKDANPVFKELARQKNAPAWNFNKYLVSGDGRVIEHFGSTASPDSQKFADAIETALAGVTAK